MTVFGDTCIEKANYVDLSDLLISFNVRQINIKQEASRPDSSAV